MLFMAMLNKIITLILFINLCSGILTAQKNASNILGCWYEVSQSKYQMLNICFYDDSTAKYLSRYPEQSNGLKYSYEGNRLVLSNGFTYRLKRLSINKIEIQMIHPAKEKMRILRRK